VGVAHMEGGLPKINRQINHLFNKALGIPAQPEKSAPVQPSNFSCEVRQ